MTVEVIASTGDRAEAPDVEAAVVAARTMYDDHVGALLVQGRGRDVSFAFHVDGRHVRTVDARVLR